MASAQRGCVVMVTLAIALACALPATADPWSASAVVYAPVNPADQLVPASRTAIDRAGYGVALYEEVEPAAGAFALRPVDRVPGGSWQAAPPIPVADLSFRWGVAIDPDGNAIAVWEEFSDTLDVIRASTWHPGGAWSAPSTVASTPDAVRDDPPSSGYFSMASNAAGQLVVVWQTAADSEATLHDHLWAVVGTPAGGLSPPVEIGGALPESDEFLDLSSSVGESGVVAVQWSDDSGQGGSDHANVQVAVGSVAGGFPSAPYTLTSFAPPASARAGAVAVDPAGGVLSLYGRWDTGWAFERLETTYRPPGGAFGAPTWLADVEGDAAWNETALAFDGQGSATAAYTSRLGLGGVSDGQTDYAAVRPSGPTSAWGAPQALLTIPQGFEPLSGAVPQIVEAPDGSALVGLDSLRMGSIAEVFSRAGASPFDGGLLLPCAGISLALAPDDDAALSCFGQDHTDDLATRGLHDAPADASTPPVAAPVATRAGAPSTRAGSKVSTRLGLRSAKVVHRRLVLRGRATARGTVTLTIRRRARRKVLDRVRLTLPRGAWTRTLRLPRGLAAGPYVLLATGSHVRTVRAAFRVRG